MSTLKGTRVEESKTFNSPSFTPYPENKKYFSNHESCTKKNEKKINKH